jgi:hypothetical protein
MCWLAGLLSIEFVSKTLLLITFGYWVVAGHLIRKRNDCYLDGYLIWNRFLLVIIVGSLLAINYVYGLDLNDELDRSVARVLVLLFSLLAVLILGIVRSPNLKTEIYFLDLVAKYLIVMTFCFLTALSVPEPVFQLMLISGLVIWIHDFFQNL